MEWNSLPHSLRDPARSADSFKSELKTHFLRRKGTFSALEVLRDALYKSTTTTTLHLHILDDVTYGSDGTYCATHRIVNSDMCVRVYVPDFGEDFWRDVGERTADVSQRTGDDGRQTEVAEF